MSIHIAQFSDTHLFANQTQLHVGANVFENLKRVLLSLAANKAIDIIIFTGDLTQDHTVESYKNFADLIINTPINKPVYFLSGNHDEPLLMAEQLVDFPFCSDNLIETEHWQLFLLPTKSDTPAGVVEKSALEAVKTKSAYNKYQWLFMHHHPVNVGYFIDRHPLLNQDDFWQAVSKQTTLRGVCCGHVHQGLDLLKEETGKLCDVLTCPATSIQFDPSIDGVAALPLGPGYRLLELRNDGSYHSDIVYL